LVDPTVVDRDGSDTGLDALVDCAAAVASRPVEACVLSLRADAPTVPSGVQMPPPEWLPARTVCACGCGCGCGTGTSTARTADDTGRVADEPVVPATLGGVGVGATAGVGVGAGVGVRDPSDGSDCGVAVPCGALPPLGPRPMLAGVSLAVQLTGHGDAVLVDDAATAVAALEPAAVLLHFVIHGCVSTASMGSRVAGSLSSRLVMRSVQSALSSRPGGNTTGALAMFVNVPSSSCSSSSIRISSSSVGAGSLTTVVIGEPTTHRYTHTWAQKGDAPTTTS
jgi:hypothetical protein